MQTHIIAIGNSRGIRIPKALLEQANLGDEVELVASSNLLTVRPVQEARKGWLASFQEMTVRGEDKLLESTELTPNEWDDLEWQW